jgi:hypothetical protein
MAVVPLWLLLSLGVAWLAADAPQVAPLPAPLTAERLVAEVAPEVLEARMEAEPGVVEPVLVALAEGLGGDGERAEQVAEYLAAVARSRGRRLAAATAGAGGGLEDGRVDAFVTLLLVHPGRFAAETGFRERVLALLPEALAPGDRAALRERVLGKLNQVDGFGFEASEALEVAWGAVPRASAGRRLEEGAARGLVFDDDVSRPLAASIYSLPSAFFAVEQARRFLAGVRRVGGEREILVLGDLPLGGDAGPLGLTLLPTHGRAYSPWPRDPLSLVRRPGGGVAVVVRPNAQPGREEDAFLGRELVQTLPERLDRAWGRPGWTVAPVPFHNGQVLLLPDAAWVTLHGVELRALEILGLARVPVEELGSPAGVDRYMVAVERAAGELAALYGRPVRFAHPLPAELPAGERPALMARLGGGAGYDLDSLLTLLPAPAGAEGAAGEAGRPVALVADPRLGGDLLATLPRGDWEGFRAAFDLAPPAGGLPAALAAALAEPPAMALADFLDVVARHLAARGFTVERLPLLVVPTALLADREGVFHARFLITWNNVVVETRGGRVRAEGFSSLLPEADRRVAAAFRRAGARLNLVPPLVRSVVLVGGYRCASSHVRR